MNLFSDGLRLGTLSSKYIPLTQVVNILSQCPQSRIPSQINTLPTVQTYLSQPKAPWLTHSVNILEMTTRTYMTVQELNPQSSCYRPNATANSVRPIYRVPIQWMNHKNYSGLSRINPQPRCYRPHATAYSVRTLSLVPIQQSPQTPEVSLDTHAYREIVVSASRAEQSAPCSLTLRYLCVTRSLRHVSQKLKGNREKLSYCSVN